jgi:hypothetical protein
MAIILTNTITGPPDNGDLKQGYSAFKNLKDVSNITEDNLGNDLGSLTLLAKEANIDINKSLELKAEPSYDDSVNLIINDKTNPLKIVNSRFYLTSSTTYNIADRRGNLDTNIYTKDNFAVETGLIKSVRSISTLDFLGIYDGGIMPVGNYTFYFKLADADGNETDFISESGRVVCHIGSVKNPTSIRGGLLNENSQKVIKFRLNNIDLAYDYINIYYSRSTGDEKSEVVKYYKIDSKFKINNLNTEITITGYEKHIEITESTINEQYSYFGSVGTTENCQNMTFAGKIQKDNSIYDTLEKYSLLITPNIYNGDSIGFLNPDYRESFNRLTPSTAGFEYYNADNIYYRLSYWEDEIYRIGIVYILNDYTLSPVFNIRGIKELNSDTTFDSFNINDSINYDEDYTINGKTRPPLTGTVSTTKDSSTIIGTNTLFLSELKSGNWISINGNIYTVLTVVNNKNITLEQKALSTLSGQTVFRISNENVKGVFKINTANDSSVRMFNQTNAIKPIGLKFTFTNDVIEGNGYMKGLKDLTKGFFFVRQKRIPTILAQGIGINTAKKTYNPMISRYYESILTNTATTANDVKAKLQRNLKVNGRCEINNNALLCPEASLRSDIYSNIFNGSELCLQKVPYSSSGTFGLRDNRFSILSFIKDVKGLAFNTNVLLIEPGTDLVNNGTTKFRSLAGDAKQAWKHLDPIQGDFENSNETDVSDWSNTVDVIRGEFNSFVGLNSSSVDSAQIYNIYQKDYNFTNNWKSYFKIRYEDSSPFFAISDRIEWNNVPDTKIISKIFRGDCYICTYTHRMIWNFIDPDLPTNKKITDPWTWYKNYKVLTKYYISRTGDGAVYSEEQNQKFYEKTEDILSGQLREATKEEYDNAGGDKYKISYSKCAPLFTTHGTMVIEPSGKQFDRVSAYNGTYGYEQINRPDVNAIPIGHWVTFKICSNYNLNMRDLDFTHPEEEAIHKYKRGFFPLQKDDPSNSLPESQVINKGISSSVGNKYYFNMPDVPFIKLSYNNRIHYSDILQEGLFRNGNRIFRASNYKDYTMEYGALTKLIEWYGTLIAIMEHGILLIPVNERAAMANASGENVYINTETVLPKNPKVISNTFGSIWPNSIIRTPYCIYGIDTVSKKIWRIKNGLNAQFEIISDFKIQKYLNDNIKLLELDKSEKIGDLFVNTHYNAFKQDVIFTYKKGDDYWSFCWNEIVNKWITRYTWIPEFSENINNLFYTFAKEDSTVTTDKYYKLWKHGFAGFVNSSEEILPTKWYGKQEPFEFEFVVIGQQGVQKIFDNLKIISNAAEPESFIYEIVGESYNWSDLKSTVSTINNREETDLTDKYIAYLKANPDVKKVPYLKLVNDFDKEKTVTDDLTANPSIYGLRDLNFVLDPKSGKYKTQIYQKACDIKKHGRLRGNMHYVEDFWDVQLQPLTFKQAYLKGDALYLTDSVETRIREKYIKIRIRYTGKKLAIITAIKTLFTISYD